MIHQIQSGNFSAQISELGAELKSFKNEKNGTEYIWYGKPEFWTGTAPILFPIVGLLKDDEYIFDGNTYKMDKHGFARKSYFKLIEKTEGMARFVLKSSERTLEMFPFEFELEVLFEILESGLKITNTVKNPDKENLYFTIGAHPAFNLPLENTSLNDYFIEFDKKEDLRAYGLSEGLLKPETQKLELKDKNRIFLSETIFNNDALIFKNINSRIISIGNIKTDFNLSLNNFGNAPHLGIWSKPGAPYVCIEPWHGHADMTNTNKQYIEKEGIIKLEKGKKFSTGYKFLV